ncbi:MAG: acetyl-CoA carboxylase carboxyltransferase subunit beta [Planctomycetes bacterium]|nr:acetyl-CoA carboxylase carboxyltransferase subunit beta [Planctomycetota bacterium]
MSETPSEPPQISDAAPSPAVEDKGSSNGTSRESKVPGGLWLKCSSCNATIYRKEMEARLHTCPACGYHFTMKGWDRVLATADEGSFEEHHRDVQPRDRLAFNDRVPYGEKLLQTQKKTGLVEAALVGLGRIEGVPVVLGVLDFAFLGGSMGEVVGEKVALACELAESTRLPLVLFTASGGARMHEGALSLMQMAKTCAALQHLSAAGGFSICVQTNPTTGGVTASFASVTDLVLAEPGALIGFAGPRVIQTTIRQALPEGFQRAEFLVQKGQVDLIVPRQEMRKRLAQLLRFVPGVESSTGS